MDWIKSSYCASNGSCVQVGIDSDGWRWVRDDAGEFITVEPDQWQAFIDGVKAGEFD